MRRALRSLIVFQIAIVLFMFPLFGQTPPPVPLVLISIDGLKPDYVLNAEKYGLKIPYLRRILAEGAHANGVTGVLPTVTYPSHTTLVTGVSPAKHGILTNLPFDPFGKNFFGWYWYTEDIKVPTLWDVAAQAGLATGNVDWPVTVGAHITYNIAQYWRAENAEDLKIIRAVSTPGLLAEAERALGPYPNGNDYTVAADRRRAAFNVYILEKKRPRFHLCYLSGLDTEQHASGPYSPQTLAALEEIDALVGQIRAAAEKIGGGRAYVAVVSDHGFVRTEKELRLNAALREAGLLQTDEHGKLKSWRAYAWYAGGSAAIMLQDTQDDEARQKVHDVLAQFSQDPNAGVDRVLDGTQARQLGGFPDAVFVVSMRPGFKVGLSLEGPVTASTTTAGMHGYLADLKEMESSFFIVGPRIPAGQDFGRIDMRDIAPTLAGLLGLNLPGAEGKDLFHTKQMSMLK